jgi:hypothetical protein
MAVGSLTLLNFQRIASICEGRRHRSEMRFTSLRAYNHKEVIRQNQRQTRIRLEIFLRRKGWAPGKVKR